MDICALTVRLPLFHFICFLTLSILILSPSPVGQRANSCAQLPKTDNPQHLHLPHQLLSSLLFPYYLCFQCQNLVCQLLLFLFQQLMDLVGLDTFWHQLEVGIILLPQLLHQADVLLLHVFKGLACDIHFWKQGLFLLQKNHKLWPKCPLDPPQ